MVKLLLLFLKGLIIGIANIIPGVSGGTVAVITGVFDRLIEAINTLFKKFKENIVFLLPILIGMGVGILGFGKILKFALASYPIETNFFFVGLIAGSIPLISKRSNINGNASIQHAIGFLVGFAAVVALAMAQQMVVKPSEPGVYDEFGFVMFVKYFFGGFIATSAMVVPGISGSLVMMLLNMYDDILGMLSDLLKFSEPEMMLKAILALIPFGLGVVAGLFSIARLIKLLFAKFPKTTYATILGLLVGSIPAVLISIDWNTAVANIKIWPAAIIVTLVLGAGGFATSFFLGKKDT